MTFKRLLSIFFNFHKTVYFNFRYFKPRIAIKLPIIFISGVKLNRMSGAIVLKGDIYPGMIVIGGNTNPLYMQTAHKCVWTNYGGVCIFTGRTFICGGSSIEIGQKGIISFGKNVYFGMLSRIACYESITIGDDCTFSWENIITDTDFHSLICLADNCRSKMSRPIVIGKNNWFGIRCCVSKGTVTPDDCTVSAYSFLNRTYNVPFNSIIGGIPAHLLKTGYKFDKQSHINPLQQ